MDIVDIVDIFDIVDTVDIVDNIEAINLEQGYALIEAISKGLPN